MHYNYLQQMAQKNFQGNLQNAILYLLYKYLPYLTYQKPHQKKKTLTITYQPPTKDYKKFWIEVEPIFWGQMNQLRFYIGYSISRIIRMIIEWAMIEEENERIYQSSLPHLSEFREERRSIRSYKVLVWGRYQNRWIVMKFITNYG